MNAIMVRGLSVALDGHPILTNISVDIPAGKIVGLLGPSGAGKTTLIRAILGLQKPSAGSIEVLGLPAGSKSLHTRVGYVTQQPSVYADLTVMENMRYFADLVGANRADTAAAIREVELQDHQRQLVGDLSGGQRTRVLLATALLGKPQLLLLDEPTVGLDPILRQNLWQQFRTLTETGTTILVSSHVMDEADRCDELLFVRDGRLLASGSKEHILAQAKAHTMADAFLNLATKESA